MTIVPFFVHLRSSALQNAESRLDVLKFNQREELEVLQLTSKQWRRSVDRHSPELALRRILFAEIDLLSGATFTFGETDDPKNTFHTSDPLVSVDDALLCDADFADEEVDYDSAEFDGEVANNVRFAMNTSKCTRLNHCFIEWLRVIGDDNGSRGVVGTDFGLNFCVWIKALQRLETDVCVQTLEVIDPNYKMNMNSVYRQLQNTLQVQEYAISKESTDMGDEGRGDELCVDVLKKAKRVSILEYYLDDDGDDDEAEEDECEDNVDVDDKPEMNGSMKNVLNFVFSAPACEELYASVEGDGSGLINKLNRRFQGLQSTSQMVFTFTWEWGINYEGCNWVKRNDCPKPTAEGHASPFKDVTLERRRPQFDLARDVIVIEQLSGDVYEFRNVHDRTYLTVVVSKEHDIVQFRKGRFELNTATADGLPDKKRRHSGSASSFRQKGRLSK
ncbi:hypothetical protein AAVH_33852, partial [Aphelenchoides avenae]